jgi:hypothetical protein
MSNPITLKGASISLPAEFEFGEVPPHPRLPTDPLPQATPSLGPLAAFAGTFKGTGFNTIFRPDSAASPTVLPTPVTGSDNILELNLTSETLTFSPALGSVPNRGSLQQPDAFLNGVPYLQAINDVTTPGVSTGIHAEPGLWMIVPETTIPKEGVTLVRMASIPHGTTINAQGTSNTIKGAPTIGKVDITPFATPPNGIPPGPPPAGTIKFASQTAKTQGTPRIPQDLTTYIAAGTITQAILDDPNTVLRNIIDTQTITETTIISIATNPVLPLFGGGTDNIAFLTGASDITLTKPVGTSPPAPNGQALQMTATFWIETVQHTILVPIFKVGQPALLLKPTPESTDKTKPVNPRQPVPTFTVRPPIDIPVPRSITVTSTQIQYSQTVMLNFNGLTWPHVSVATLVPDTAVPVPPSVW